MTHLTCKPVTMYEAADGSCWHTEWEARKRSAEIEIPERLREFLRRPERTEVIRFTGSDGPFRYELDNGVDLVTWILEHRGDLLDILTEH